MFKCWLYCLFGSCDDQITVTTLNIYTCQVVEARDDSNDALTPGDEKSGELVIEDSVSCAVLEMIQCHGEEPELEHGHPETTRFPLNGLVVPVTVGRNTMLCELISTGGPETGDTGS